MLTSTWSENYSLAARKRAEKGPVQINRDFLDWNCGTNTIYPNLYMTDSSYAGVFFGGTDFFIWSSKLHSKNDIETLVIH